MTRKTNKFAVIIFASGWILWGISLYRLLTIGFPQVWEQKDMIWLSTGMASVFLALLWLNKHSSFTTEVVEK